MKICVLGNQARAVFLFWKVLMRQMLAAGHAVFCLLPDGYLVRQGMTIVIK